MCETLFFIKHACSAGRGVTIAANYAVWFCFFVFLAFDFCQFCVVIRFFHPRHNGQWLPTSKDFLSQILSITFKKKSYLNSSERAGISLLMLIAKQGNYWYHFITSLVWRDPWLRDWTRDLPHSKPALYHYARKYYQYTVQIAITVTEEAYILVEYLRIHSHSYIFLTSSNSAETLSKLFMWSSINYS